VQSSSVPMEKLRFGDFSGDGVTDVLAVVSGRWSISESARGQWTVLNRHLSSDVRSLYIADLDNNNIDDIIRLETKIRGAGPDSPVNLTWWVSDDGRSRWRELRSYSTTVQLLRESPGLFAFSGRFGAEPGAGVLLTDVDRKGRFFSEADGRTGPSAEWTSRFAY
jgi:hypothetical protein